MRLLLELLEDRTVPTVLAVVSSSIPTGTTRFHTLAAAIAAAQNGDTIQIGAGSAPGNATIALNVLTIEGDPTGPLPVIGQLTLQSAGNVLFDLNVTTLDIASGAVNQTVTNCLVQDFTQIAGLVGNGGNLVSNNTITGSMVMGNNFPSVQGAAKDIIINNAFLNSTSAATLLSVTHDNGATIKGNYFNSPFDGTIGIQVADSTSLAVSDNRIALAGPNSVGVKVENPVFDTSVAVDSNRIDTSGQGTGIMTVKTAGLTLNVAIAGNDLVGNNVGINIVGDGSSLGTIDAGNGVLGSNGGNNFRGYLSTGSGGAAIVTSNGGGLVTAEQNIFSVSNPGTVVIGPGAMIDVNSPLSANQSFVQTLYNDFLGRSGSLAELNGWVGNLPGFGQAGVATDIIHSMEADQNLVAGLYGALLGRVGSTAEEAGWVNALMNGATQEQIMSGILSSPEFVAHAQVIATSPSDPGTDYVAALYALLLGRAGGSSEIAGWVNNVLASQGTAAVATGILSSSEFRSDIVQLLYAGGNSLLSPLFLNNIPDMLNRAAAPSAAEASIWSASALDLLGIEAGIASSSEFFANG